MISERSATKILDVTHKNKYHATTVAAMGIKFFASVDVLRPVLTSFQILWPDSKEFSSYPAFCSGGGGTVPPLVADGPGVQSVAGGPLKGYPIIKSKY